MKSHSHIEAARKLHESSKVFGGRESYKKKNQIKNVLNLSQGISYVNTSNRPIKSILDYGTGKGGLIEVLQDSLSDSTKIIGYDPAVDKFSKRPSGKFDLVTCIDVLEHVDRHVISEVLEDIKNLTEGIFFYCIDLIPAVKKLEDGRNAHILLAPSDWWAQQLGERFTMNLNFHIGKTASNEPRPVRFIGCSTNDHSQFKNAAWLLHGTKLATKKWIY